MVKCECFPFKQTFQLELWHMEKLTVPIRKANSSIYKFTLNIDMLNSQHKNLRRAKMKDDWNRSFKLSQISIKSRHPGVM